MNLKTAPAYLLRRLNFTPFSEKDILQAFKYGLVGVLNTLITLSLIFIIKNLSGIDYRFANAAGFIAGFINSFLMNKFWTFKSGNHVFKEMILFIIVFLTSYGIQLASLMLMVEIIGIPFVYSQLTGMIIYTGCGFVGNKLITFRETGSTGKNS